MKSRHQRKICFLQSATLFTDFAAEMMVKFTQTDSMKGGEKQRQKINTYWQFPDMPLWATLQYFSFTI